MNKDGESLQVHDRRVLTVGDDNAYLAAGTAGMGIALHGSGRHGARSAGGAIRRLDNGEQQHGAAAISGIQWPLKERLRPMPEVD